MTNPPPKNTSPTVKASISFTTNSEENFQERLSEHLKQIEKTLKLTLRGKTPENQFSWKMTFPFGAVSAYFQRLLLLVSGSVFIGSKKQILELYSEYILKSWMLQLLYLFMEDHLHKSG